MKLNKLQNRNVKRRLSLQSQFVKPLPVIMCKASGEECILSDSCEYVHPSAYHRQTDRRNARNYDVCVR